MSSQPIEPDDRIRVLAIAGSLRRASWNRRLVEAARALAPDHVAVDVFDLAGVPLYDADLDTDERRPEPVRALRQAVADADALLISTPEYNHSVPGVLQNALDWLSRPAMQSPLADKPVGVMGATTGALGAARAQQQLKLVLMATLAHVMPHPGVAVGAVAEKFAADGTLAHEPTRRFLAAFVAQLAGWTRRLRRTTAAEAA